jgi:hypothetical protein
MQPSLALPLLLGGALAAIAAGCHDESDDEAVVLEAPQANLMAEISKNVFTTSSKHAISCASLGKHAGQVVANAKSRAWFQDWTTETCLASDYSDKYRECAMAASDGASYRECAHLLPAQWKTH